MAVQYYVTDAASNVLIRDVPVPPNCPTGNIDNALRALCSDLAEWRDQQAINVRVQGARGDGVTDDTQAIRNCIALAGVTGRGLYFPRGRYKVSLLGGTSECLLFPRAIRVRGDGTTYTAIIPDASVPATAHIIRCAPAPGFSYDFAGFEDIFFGNPDAGASAGGPKLFIDTTAPFAYIAQFVVRRCYLQRGGGTAKSLVHTNSIAHRYAPFTAGKAELGALAIGGTITGATSGATATLIAAPSAATGTFAAGTATGTLQITVVSGVFQNGENINVAGVNSGTITSASQFINGGGGLALAIFERCSITGGALIQKAGDSISFFQNSFSGFNGGLDIDLVFGASHLIINSNNNFFISAGAPLVIRDALRAYVEHNEFELIDGTGDNNAIISWYNSGYPTGGAGGRIACNLISAIGTSSPAYLVRVNNQNGLRVEANNFVTGGQYTLTAAGLNDGSTPIHWDPAQEYTAGISTDSRTCFDGSAASTGIRKDVTLANGWAAFTTAERIRLIKTRDGYVTLEGAIKSGTGSPFTLPAGLQPEVAWKGDLYSHNGTSKVVCDAVIGTNGVCTINGGSNVEVRFPAIRFRTPGGATTGIPL